MKQYLLIDPDGETKEFSSKSLAIVMAKELGEGYWVLENTFAIVESKQVYP